MLAVPAALLGTHLTAARFVNSSVFAGSGLRRRGPGCPGVEPRRISASVICCRVRCRSPWGKFAVKVGGGHATVHGEVAAGDERPVGAHEQHADGPYLIWGAATPDRRQLDHAPVSLAAGSGQLVLGERGEDNAGAGTSRCLA